MTNNRRYKEAEPKLEFQPVLKKIGMVRLTTVLDKKTDEENIALLNSLVMLSPAVINGAFQFSYVSYSKAVFTLSLIELNGIFLQQIDLTTGEKLAKNPKFFSPEAQAENFRNSYAIQFKEGTGALVNLYAEKLNEYGIIASCAAGPRLIVLRNEYTNQLLKNYADKMKEQLVDQVEKLLAFYQKDPCCVM